MIGSLAQYQNQIGLILLFIFPLLQLLSFLFDLNYAKN